MDALGHIVDLSGHLLPTDKSQGLKREEYSEGRGGGEKPMSDIN
jgi:hypothetical protein